MQTQRKPNGLHRTPLIPVKPRYRKEKEETKLYDQLLPQGLAGIPLRLAIVSAQDVFISWVHSYADFHKKTNCWLCGATPTSVMGGFPW